MMSLPQPRAVLAALALCASLAQAAWADLGTPTGPVLLTVTSADGTSVALDRAMFEEIGLETITTLTPFTEGEQQFTGVSLRQLMDATGVEGETIDAVALNDYRVELPASHADDYDVFLALDQNGTPMRIRDKGPVWIIYPGDEIKAAPDRFDRYMVWQLRELGFR